MIGLLMHSLIDRSARLFVIYQFIRFLGVFFYFAGRENIGSWGIAIVPENAGFFAWTFFWVNLLDPAE